MPGKLKVAGAVIAIAWVIAVLRADKPAVIWREHPWIAGAALGLSLWTLASALWAPDRATALSAAGRMAIGVALMIIVFTVARDRDSARWLIVAYIAGGVLTVLYGVIFKPGQAVEGVFDPTRLYGGMGEPNDLGAVLLPAIALGLFSLPFVRNIVGRLALAAAVVVLAAGLLLSQSRGALVAAVVMLVAGVCLAGRLRAWIGALCCVMIAAGVGYYFSFASDATHARVNSLLRIDAYGGLSDGSGRKELWKAAIELIRDHPVLGVGARNFRTVTGESMIVHNTYLEILAGLGAVGMLLFLSVIAGAIVMALRGIRNGMATRDIEGEFQARGALVGIVGLLSSYVFISGEFQPQFLWLLGLAVACGGPRLREPSDESLASASDSELVERGWVPSQRERDQAARKNVSYE